MSNTLKTAIPVVLQVGGVTVFNGEIHLSDLLKVITNQPSSKSIIHKSTALNEDQMRQLMTKVDQKTVVFLKRIATNDGSITFREMCQIFDITEWSGFSSRFGKGLTKALRHMTNDATAALVWWVDEEWGTDSDPDGEVYIDGPSLQSLKAVAA
ncbi:hypothetical protein K431DRAFT_308227 [Polychaeton citri CBS 116435]|uniref:Uncharacterized protein n=1 Tax=Polychaeton citri CBS 116435 TaxID=1314669 RepID=A0A9P4PY03_9PEZI|nr:hypothetical protein K431DRAFT_308227 [Polychaeton citri CBS 116435]